jgi:cruciform cutting endonuclease 1
MSLPTVTPATWLSKLTIAQLRRVAFAIGAPSSGTKPVLTRQIQRELGASNTAKADDRSQQVTQTSPWTLSIVSIDLGIRNLAYAHLLSLPVSLGAATETSEHSTDQRPSLVAWKRVVISSAPNSNHATTKGKKKREISNEVASLPLIATNGASGEGTTPAPQKEAFDPSTFAKYAYSFIKRILSIHQPTHVLIERQRFRSGGASAVQEWTIRVGVFEGMLHAVLKTLSEELGLQVAVHGIDPGRVTRYWLEGRAAQGNRRVRTAKESKKTKIDIVGESLTSPNGPLVVIGPKSNQLESQDVAQLVDAFLARWKKKDRSGKDHSIKDVLKLDDLSDCLLQGVAWLNWQRKRQDVVQRGLEAFADDPLFVAVLSSRLGPVIRKPRDGARKSNIR